MTDCRFCEIVKKDREGAIIFEDKNFISFLDINPLFFGHSLLIPKAHYNTFYDLPETLEKQFMVNAKKIGKAIEKALNADGTLLAMNNVVSQSVPHVHLHIVPRKRGDGLKGFFWPRAKYENLEQMQEISQKIANQIKKNNQI